VEALGQQQWRLQLEARSAQVPQIRHEVVDVLERECPGVDLAAAALVVTELAANVVTHAYEEPGRIEVDVMCEPDAVVVTLRDWGRGFGRSGRKVRLIPRSWDLGVTVGSRSAVFGNLRPLRSGDARPMCSR
jgi:anti-sigma regulatory factor (Ser/Thr protein kinase)